MGAALLREQFKIATMSQPELKRIREGLSNFLNPSEFIYETLIADVNFEENRCLSSKPKVKASNEDESKVQRDDGEKTVG
jgi:hypothetical protein